MSGSSCGNNINRSSTSGAVKWECATCTYENWPASTHCTICRTQQSIPVLNEEGIQQRLQVSANELGAVVESTPCLSEHQLLDITEIQLPPVRCPSCTYSNKPNAFKCEQCFHVLCDPPPHDNQETFVGRPVTSCSNIVPSSMAAPDSRLPTSVVTLSNCQQRQENKWTCAQCTYENWPKSQLCVMCRTPPPAQLFSLTSLNYVLDTPVDTSNEVFDIGQASLAIPGLGISETSTSDSGAAGSNAGGRRQKTTSGGSGFQLNIREKLWLAACKAVINREVNPIERYLLSGGRVDRKLTKQECHQLNSTLLGEPQSNVSEKRPASHTEERVSPDSIDSPISPQQPTSDLSSAAASASNNRFRAGLTLVDLAIRYGRADLINLFVAIAGLQATSHAVFGYNSASPSSSSPSPPSSHHSSKTSTARPQSLSAKTRHHAHSSSLTGTNTSPSATVCATSAVLTSPMHQLTMRTPACSTQAGTASGSRSKWMPCQASSHVARDIREAIAAGIRYRRGDFPCAYCTEFSTFALPHSIAKLPPSVKYLLLSELCDTQAQSELEDDAKAINWWFIPRHKQASCLFALWNRTAGDCLLDSVLQSCWGVFDRENHLRRTLAECLRTCEANFYSRWRDYEAMQAACHYILDEVQCRRDWENVLAAAKQPKGALEQIHIFALSHILRRPIIVYGVRYIKNFRDEPIGIANFQGIYIPLLWEHSFCSRNPIVLGYTRGHFTALVPMEPPPSAQAATPAESPAGSSSSSTSTGAIPASSPRLTSSSRKPSPPLSPTAPESEPLDASSQEPVPSATAASSNLNAVAPFVYLPLVDRQGGFLPIHFTTEKEADLSQMLLRDWLDVVSTRRGLPLARLRLQPRHPLVNKMTDDWLESYRSLARIPAGTTSSGSHVVRMPDSSSSSSSSDYDAGSGNDVAKSTPTDV